MRLLQSRLYRYGKEKKLLTPGDQFTVDLIEKAKLPVFFFVVFDCLFFSSHTLAHSWIERSRTPESIASLLIAFTLLMLLSADISRLILWNFFSKRPTKADILEQILVKSVLKAKKSLPSTPLSRVVEIFRRKHLEAVNRIFVDFESMAECRPSEDNFIDSGIRPVALVTSYCARYFNLLTFLKTMSMEVIFVTMQASGWLQEISLLFVQTIYTLYMAYCLLRAKIFSTKYYAWALALHEVCLLAFFSLVAAMQIQGASVYRLKSDTTALQLWVLVSLVIATMTGVILLLCSQIKALMTRCSNRSSTNAQEEAENTRLLGDIATKLQTEGYLERLMLVRSTPKENQNDASVNKELLSNNQKQILSPLNDQNQAPEKDLSQVRLPKFPHRLKKRNLQPMTTRQVGDLRTIN